MWLSLLNEILIIDHDVINQANSRRPCKISKFHKLTKFYSYIFRSTIKYLTNFCELTPIKEDVSLFCEVILQILLMLQSY